MKQISKLFAFVSVSAVISSAGPAQGWGGTGHKFVARLAIANLPPSNLKQWLAKNETWFANASSHPDRWRNRVDHSEAPRHFLDTENFGFGTDALRIPLDFEAVLKLRTYEQLRTDGVNPWTIGRVRANLVKAMREKRWEDVLVQAAYLSHYVGDAHVPFHASANYDGQLSTPPQRGIHSRFEEKLVERTIKFEDLVVGTPDVLGNPIADAIRVLNDSIKAVPTILAADKAASSGAGSTINDDYFDKLSLASRSIAKQRLEAAGRNLAGELKAAWELAGKPTPDESVAISDEWLPYAPPFVPRGTTAPPAQPVIPEESKLGARKNVISKTFFSSLLKKDVTYNIAFPASYGSDNRKYPVVYLLHGAWGSFDDWNSKTGVAAYTATTDFIVVMPDSNGNSWYNDSQGAGPVESFVTDELRKDVEKHFRTINHRSGRALIGLSMGGYGAIHLAIEHQELYCAAASLSGAVGWGTSTLDKNLLTMAKDLYPTDTDQNYQKDALIPGILRHVKNGIYEGPSLYFDCGKEDFLIKSNQDLEAALLAKQVPHEYSEFDGAHTWTYWDAHIRDAYQFMKRQLSKPRN
ncbi:MAG: S1/P1 nuclease [Armatimonadota bacterium]